MTRDKNTCMNCTRKSHSLICDLSYKELEILEQNRQVVNYKPGEIIYKEGIKPFGLICLNEGKVKITIKGDNDKELIVELKKPVDFLGFTEMMAEESYTTSAVALVDSMVCIIDKNDFFKVVKGNSDLSLKIMNLLGKNLLDTHRRTLMLTQKDLKSRLAGALMELYNIYGVSSTNGKTLNTLLKRDDLASLSSMTMANVSRTLSHLEKEKIISFRLRKIKILNINKLEEMASSQN